MCRDRPQQVSGGFGTRLFLALWTLDALAGFRV